MKPEEQRLRNKLALWDTAGFSQFVTDLAESISDIINIPLQVEVLKKRYKNELEKMQPKSKFKQTKLPI